MRNNCYIGMPVFYQGEKCIVSEILQEGTKKEKACITACRIFKGQVLSRSPFFVGFSWEPAVTPDNNLGKYINYQGRSRTRSEWAAYLGIKPCTFSTWIKRYGSPVKAIKHGLEVGKSDRRGKLFEYTGKDFVSTIGVEIKKGDKHHLGDWSKYTGIRYQTIIARLNSLKADKSFNDVISRPLQQR